MPHVYRGVRQGVCVGVGVRLGVIPKQPQRSVVVRGSDRDPARAEGGTAGDQTDSPQCNLLFRLNKPLA